MNERERERGMMTAMSLVLLALLAGYVVHVDRRFAGSALGGLLGVAGALLMLGPLIYVPVKRVQRLRVAITRRFAMFRLLRWHIVAGLLGPVLAILHTGHRFESRAGIALVVATVILPLSGYVGYVLRSRLLASERALAVDAKQLRAVLDGLLAASPQTPENQRRTREVAESLADIEIARSSRRLMHKAFGTWNQLHVLLSGTLYALLVVHVWAAFRFGVRWWPS